MVLRDLLLKMELHNNLDLIDNTAGNLPCDVNILWETVKLKILALLQKYKNAKMN